MGDRAQVYVKDRGHDVYLYTHWGSHELESDVKRALNRSKDRWGDPSYLTRIIFCDMVLEDLEGTTGYGIQSQPSDDTNRDITVDCEKQSITVSRFGRPEFDGSFQEFIDS